MASPTTALLLLNSHRLYHSQLTSLILPWRLVCVLKVHPNSIQILPLHFTEPSSPPQEYVATNISSRIVQFSWYPPAITEQNGVITNYTLACSPKVDGVNSITKIYEDAGSYTLGGFRPATEYNCSVFASNAAGNSPKASIITIITQDESKQIHSHLVRITVYFHCWITCRYILPSPANWT